jgi:hypothetical protein
MGAEYKPDWLPESRLIATYFNIAYSDRISQISNGTVALTDPIDAPFVTRSPSAGLQQTLINAAGGVLTNYTGAPYDPSSIVAVIDDRYRNIAKQNVKGIDVLFNKTIQLSAVNLDAFLNSTYLQLQDRITDAAPEQQLAGTVFNPPRFRLRGGATVKRGGWSGTGTINYIGHESNNLIPGAPSVSPWTTIDAQLAYQTRTTGLFSGFRVSLSAINLLNRNPPYLEFNTFRTGFNYDVANATPVGRFVSLQLQKGW